MRDSLARSILDSPVRNQVHYAAGSIVICNACAKPIYKLDRPIGLGQGAGRSASAFKPLSLADLAMLEDRNDVDTGIRAMLRRWDIDARTKHLALLDEPRSGNLMACPACHECFVQVLATEASELLDRAYVIELVTIPPSRALPLRGGSTWRYIH